MVGEPHGQEEHIEDTDNLGEQLEYTQTEHPRMHVHNTNNTENKHSIAENHCPVRGFHMLLEKPKTPQQQHEKWTCSETQILDRYLLKLFWI